MKINSNTLNLIKESYDFKALEQIIHKVASENNIENVESVEITLAQNQGIVGFKIAQEMPIEEEQVQQQVPQQPQPVAQQPQEQVQQQPQEQPQETAPEEETENVEEPVDPETEVISEEEGKVKLDEMRQQYEEAMKNQDTSWLQELAQLAPVPEQKQ